MMPGAFRLILAMAVVIHHSFPLRLGAWAVGLFFVLSGYWIARMWRQKYSQRERPYASYLVSRWWRLAPLYLGVQVLALGLMAAGLDVGNAGMIQRPGWVLTQPLILGGAQFGTLLPPLWSLDVEAQFYVIAPLLIAGLSVVAPARGVLLALTLSIAWAFWRQGALSAETPHVDSCLWMFLAGVGYERINQRLTSSWAAASAVAFLLLVAGMLLDPSARPFVWQRGADEVETAATARYGWTFAMVAVSVPFALATVHRKSGAWDRWMGDLSYPLYVFHWIPREVYYDAVDWSLPAYRNAAIWVAHLIAGVIGSILLLHFVDRPAQAARGAWLAQRPAARATTAEAK